MPTYTIWDEVMASPTQPLDLTHQQAHLALIQAGFDSLQMSEKPTAHDWQVVATAINLMEALIEMGHLADPQQLHADTVRTMSTALKRFHAGAAHIRLDGPGLQAVKHLLEDYREALAVLPYRTMIQAYRRTEAKVVAQFGKHSKKRNVKGRF